MKTLFLSILFITSLTLNAQITKNNWMMGGDISFSYTESKSDIGGKTFTMKGSPNIGYFFFNKVAVGAKIDYTFSRSKFETGTTKFDRLLASPFARYYFLEVEKPFNVFLESSYGFSLFNENNLTEFSAKAGAAIFLNRSVAFEIALEYLNSNTNNIYVGSNTILLGFGIQVYLEREK